MTTMRLTLKLFFLGGLGLLLATAAPAATTDGAATFTVTLSDPTGNYNRRVDAYWVTDSTGKFSIENIPPGTYQLVVWHPQTGPGVSKTVTIQPDGTLHEQLSLLAPKGNRSAFKVMDNPRFGPDTLGYSVDIQPLVEHQH